MPETNAWTRIASRLARRIGESRFAEIRLVLNLLRLDEDEAVFCTPSSRDLERVRAVVGRHLEEAVRECTNRKTRVLFTVIRCGPPAAPVGDGFIVGASNRCAYEHAKSFVESPVAAAPLLVIHGRSGTGKTVLLEWMERAAASYPHVRPSLRLSVDEFSRRFAASVRDGDTAAFRRCVRAVRLLLVDELDALAGREGTTDELLRTIEAVIDHGGRVAASALVPARRLCAVLPPLRRRLAAGLEVELQPPDEEFRRRWIEAQGLRGPAAEALAARGPADLRALGRCVREVLRNGATMTAVDAVVNTCARSGWARATMEDVLHAVAAEFGVKAADILSARRDRRIAAARAAAGWVARRVLGMSFDRIAAELGGRSHTAVLQGYRKVESGRPVTLRRRAERIAGRLGAPASSGRPAT
jgi:chromosomal replication initiator protein